MTGEEMLFNTLLKKLGVDPALIKTVVAALPNIVNGVQQGVANIDARLAECLDRQTRMEAMLSDLLLRIPHSDGQMPAGYGAATAMPEHPPIPGLIPLSNGESIDLNQTLELPKNG